MFLCRAFSRQITETLRYSTLFNTSSFSLYAKVQNSETTTSKTDGERNITQILNEKFPNSKIEVTDISGGCGSMYEVYIESSLFENIRIVKQHKLVNEALKDQVKAMHGIRIFTSVPNNK